MSRDYCESCGYTDSHDPNCPRPLAICGNKEQAYLIAAEALRAEIKRLEYPRSMFPQQATNIARRQEAFEVAARYLEGS